MNDAEFLSKSSLSDAASYAEIGEYWDHHSLAEVWDQTESVPVVIADTPHLVYFPLEVDLSAKIRNIAEQRGTSAESLLNEWVREKTAETKAVGTAK